jgi:hypothetical protein
MIVDCLAHVHSSFSYDSPTDLADIAAVARANGIGCVLMSEHNNTLDDEAVKALVDTCAAVSTPDCLVVPGLELSLDENRIHLLAYGVRRFIPSLEARRLHPLIERIHELDGAAVLAHPAHKEAWKRVSPDDLAGIDGMEVWNVRNGGRYCPHEVEVAAVGALRQQGRRMHAFAGLDWHYLSHFERLVLRVAVPAVEASLVLRELRAGRFAIHGRFMSFAQDEELSTIQRMACALSTRALLPLRRNAYRWQARLERRGWSTPKSLAGVARRIF